MLREQSLMIPNLVSLPHIVAYVDDMENMGEELTASHVYVDEFMAMIRDLRCWIKYSYTESQIPELTRINAVRRCINLIIKVTKLCWRDYEALEVERNSFDLATKDGKKKYHKSAERMADFLYLIKCSLTLIDWLCNRKQEHFIFNEEYGQANLQFIIEYCNNALSVFRRPIQEKSRTPMEELAHNTLVNKEVQQEKKFYTFPFTSVSAIMQNILYQLVRADTPFLN